MGQSQAAALQHDTDGSYLHLSLPHCVLLCEEASFSFHTSAGMSPGLLQVPLQVMLKFMTSGVQGGAAGRERFS